MIVSVITVGSFDLASWVCSFKSRNE